MKKALILGILSSFFFAFTFIFNRSMNLSGGYWLWSACLRYFFTLPLMAILVWWSRGMKDIIKVMRQNLISWIIWSTVGFGLFYMPLTMASVYGESWFVAATWQITIVCGIFLTPILGRGIPKKNLMCSIIILLGIALLQTAHFQNVEKNGVFMSFLLIVIAAFSYPLGNRKMMEICPTDLSTIQRVFGMTLCSMPFWIICAFVSFTNQGLPSMGQMTQSFIVALFSGVIATLLFFEATNLVKHNQKQLAVIEATQSGEVLFTLLGGVLFLGDSMPSSIGLFGIALIVIGMIINSFIAS